MSIDALRAGIDWGFETFGEYMAQLRTRGSVANVAAYVGHSSVRTYVMGDDAARREATRRRDRADAGDRPRRDGARRRRLRQQHEPGAQRRRRPADAVAAGERCRDGGARRRDGRRRPRRLHADQGRAHEGRVPRVARGGDRPAGDGRGAAPQQRRAARGVRRPRRDRRRQRARPSPARPGVVLRADDGLHARVAVSGRRAGELEAGARHGRATS